MSSHFVGFAHLGAHGIIDIYNEAVINSICPLCGQPDTDGHGRTFALTVVVVVVDVGIDIGYNIICMSISSRFVITRWNGARVYNINFDLFMENCKMRFT